MKTNWKSLAALFSTSTGSSNTHTHRTGYTPCHPAQPPLLEMSTAVAEEDTFYYLQSANSQSLGAQPWGKESFKQPLIHRHCTQTHPRHAHTYSMCKLKLHPYTYTATTRMECTHTVSNRLTEVFSQNYLFLTFLIQTHTSLKLELCHLTQADVGLSHFRWRKRVSKFFTFFTETINSN